MDGDARGGAALSMRAVTGKPIKFAGVGEALDALEPSIRSGLPAGSSAWATSSAWSSAPPRPSRMEEAEALAAKMAKGQFDLNDLRTQLKQMQRMGGLGALAGMLPGMKGMKGAMDKAGLEGKVLVRMDAIIGSMTPKERSKPELINAKRKIRIAKGSGHDGAGREQAPQDAPGNGHGDEAAQEDGRPRQARRHVRRAAWAAPLPGGAALPPGGLAGRAAGASRLGGAAVQPAPGISTEFSVRAVTEIRRKD